MSCVLVGIGGTGSKILESFTFLSVMGLPHKLGLSEFHLRVVDTDEDNGNFKRLNNLLTLLNKPNGLHEKLAAFQDSRWVPIPIKHQQLRTRTGETNQDDVNSTFQWHVDLTSLGNLGSMISESDVGGNSDFLRALYSDTDQIIPIKEGCHGKPRIGALIYEDFFKRDITRGINSFWRSLHTVALSAAMQQGKKGGKIMFTGSIFGGTGASGIPTIAQCFCEEFFGQAINSTMGLTLMLPYYHYNDIEDTSKCPAKSRDFGLNSKLALRYYHDSDFLKNIKNANPSLYLVGQKQKLMVKSDDTPVSIIKAGNYQDNPSLPAELTAAFSIMHFYSQPNSTGEKVIYIETFGEEENTKLKIESLPFIKIKEKKREVNVSLGKCLLRLKLFSVLWSVLAKQKPNSERTIIPYRDLTNLKKEGAVSWENYLKDIDDFCERALEWLCQLEANGLVLNELRQLLKNIDMNLSSPSAELPNEIKIDNISICGIFYQEIFDAVNKLRRERNEYLRLLYAVMQVCCKYYSYKED